MIDDADDAGVDGGVSRIEGETRLFAADEKHLLADARANGIHGDERPAGRLAIGRQRLHDEQLDPDEGVVLSSRDDVTNHAPDLH